MKFRKIIAISASILALSLQFSSVTGAPLNQDAQSVQFAKAKSKPTPTPKPKPKPKATPKPTSKPKPTQPPAQTQTPVSSNSSYDEMVNEVVRLVNIERANVGAAPLSLNAQVQESAMKRASEITVLFEHTRPDGRPFETSLPNDLTYKALAENIHMGSNTAAGAVNEWIHSSGHRENILNPIHNGIGVGIARGSDGALYWVQIFIGQ